MERTAIKPPKACFGLEQNLGNSVCLNCAYREDCADIMWPLANRLNVDEAQFELTPPALMDSFAREIANADLQNMEGVYAFCHEWVFDQESKGNISKYREIIQKRATEAGTSPKLFFLANMLGWKQSHPESPFWRQILTGDFAVRQVEVFKKACGRMYGSFDIFALDLVTGSRIADQDFERQLLDSEILAGTWIVNYKLSRSGNLYQRLYAEKETALSPYWLAIEQSYHDHVLESYLNAPDSPCPDVVRKHRWNTIQILKTLKRHRHRAMSVFSAREQIMPQAIGQVLCQRGFLAEHFKITDDPITNAIKFWAMLGNAIQHYELLKLMDNNPSVFDGRISC